MSNALIQQYQEKITIKRFEVGEYVDGSYVDGTESEFDMLAVITPMGLRELQLLPEGQNDQQWINIYSEVELQTGVEKLGVRADRILWNGDEFEVLKTSKRNQIQSLSHFKSQAMLYTGVK